MKLQVIQENLNKALSNVAKVASTRSTLPILSNILLKTVDNRLYIAGTDLNIAITHYIGAKITSEGAITVPARLTQDLIASLPGGVVELTLDGSKLHVKTDKHSSVINGMPADDFPVMPQIKKGLSWKAPAKELKMALNQTAIAAGSDDARPVLTGVNFHTDEGLLYVVATDGYRLAEKKISTMKDEMNLTVPSGAINDLLRIMDSGDNEIKILNDDQQILFTSGDIELTSRLIDGTYPDYRKLIPSNFSVQAEADKNELLSAVKISSLFARESAGSVVIAVSDNKIEINSIASQVGENSATADAKTTGEGNITLNARYLLDGLNAIDSDKITIGFNDKLEPFILKGVEKDDYIHVVMPLKS